MVKEISYVSPVVHYLTINGKYLTPNNSFFPPSAITGTLGAGSTLTDWRATPNIKELAINLTIQELSGISPSLAINLLILDPIESSNGISTLGSNPPLVTLPIVSGSSPLTSTGVVRFTISRSGEATAWVNGAQTALGSFPVPFKWQLEFVVGGSGTTLGVIGTYEGRE